MHATEWPRVFLERKEVRIRNCEVQVIDSTGWAKGIVSDSGIVNAYWQGDAVIVEYRNGNRVRWYGPYGSQREQL